MKKTLLLSLILLSGILLTACNKNSKENVVENGETTENTIEIQQQSISENEELLENNAENEELSENDIKNEELLGIFDIQECKNTVQKYIDDADKEGNGEEVKVGDNITVDYIGRLEDGTVFDTSVESIAKICGKYMEGRDYTQGLTFQVGAGQMIKGFDNGVVGMKVGQTKTVQFGPEEGYGQHDDNLLIPISIDELGDISRLSEGDRILVLINDGFIIGLSKMNKDNLGGYPATVAKITDKEVILDMNSELAGKNLIFDITLKSIN